MNRILASALLVLAVAIPVAACDTEDDSQPYASYAGGGGSYASGDCNSYTSCGSCTPVEGCGWCFNATSGLCTTDPDYCENVSEFTWTWDPSGCPGLDASVVPIEAGSKSTTPEAGTPAPEASTSAPDTGVAVPESGTTAPTDASPVGVDAH